MVTASYIAEILKTLLLNEQSNGQLNSLVETLTGLLIINNNNNNNNNIYNAQIP